MSDRKPKPAVLLRQAKHAVLSAVMLASLNLLAGCGESPNNPLGKQNISQHPIAQCAAKSDLLTLGSGQDAEPVTPTPAAINVAETANLNNGACKGNTEFTIGSAVFDMTGPAGDSISAGYEDPGHVLRGIHLRQFARAFSLHSPCNGNSTVIVITETGFITQGTRQTVVDLVAADPELNTVYNSENIMLSATHTHSGPGGEAHHTAYNVFRTGYDDYVHQIYTDSIYQAIKRAHQNRINHPEASRIRLAADSLLDTNDNRSEPAYAQNPEQERSQHLDINGNEVRTDKQMLQLRFDRSNGEAIGLLNYFPVHTTSVGTHEPLISSDNKGLAAITLERIQQTTYPSNPEKNTFVAAFAQSGHGDTTPNLCFREHPFPDVQIGCGLNTLQSNAASAAKQFNRAVQLFEQGGSNIQGGIYSMLFHAKMDEITITDPVILNSLDHPSNLDESPKRTCSAALGYSMAAGAEDNRGPSQEGITCDNIGNPVVVANDINTALASIAANANAAGYPTIPASTTGTLVGCAIGEIPGLPDLDYSCQAEKPVLFPIGTTEFISNAELPLQIMVIGNFAIVALPWEVTTTSARRISQTVQTELADNGVNHVVVASLSNDFVQYLTTREEYSSQQYEGASTHFGPWTLAAVQQEVRKIALALSQGQATPTGVDAPRTTPALPNRPAYRPGDRPPANGFGSLVIDANTEYSPGDTVTVRFAGGHPRNDTLERRNSSYLFVDYLNHGEWQTISRDRDPELILRWHANPESPAFGQSQPSRSSEIEAIWNSPANLPAGTYRIRHQGVAVPDSFSDNAGVASPYEGISREFVMGEPSSDCPGYPALF